MPISHAFYVVKSDLPRWLFSFCCYLIHNVYKSGSQQGTKIRGARYLAVLERGNIYANFCAFLLKIGVALAPLTPQVPMTLKLQSSPSVVGALKSQAVTAAQSLQRLRLFLTLCSAIILFSKMQNLICPRMRICKRSYLRSENAQTQRKL